VSSNAPASYYYERRGVTGASTRTRPDAPGRPSLVLKGRDEVGRAGLVMSSFEESSEVGASAVISFIEGRVLLSLRNADGSELTLTP
jgi:hypothetical protein